MTKKHFEAIAAILKIERDSFIENCNDEEGETVKWLAERLADYFATDNPRFNRARFLKACGVEATCPHCGYTNCPSMNGGTHCTPT